MGPIREIKWKARAKAKEATRSDGCKRIKEEMGSKYLQKKTTGQRDIATEERAKFFCQLTHRTPEGHVRYF